MSIIDNLTQVRQRVSQRAARVGRDPGEILVVAVSKTFPGSFVEEAAAAGQKDFGENRIQEGEDKIPAVEPQGLVWHLIGHLQSNKAKRAIQLFDWIHSVDSLALLRKLDQYAGDLQKPVRVLLQLNLAGEATKYGMNEAELDEALRTAAGLKQVSVEGLMIIPPFYDDPVRARPLFRRLRELLEIAKKSHPTLPLRHLSMGMTHDFEEAIEEGSTIVRIGTAIFGKRTP